MPANFGPHQSGPGPRPPPPNQMAPGLVSRHMQKLAPGGAGVVAGQPLPSRVQQSLRLRGPLSAMAVMKPGGPSMMHHPAHGLAPPSYASSAHAAGKHPGPAQGYGPGHNPGHKLPPYDLAPQHQSNGAMSGPPRVGGGPASEVDFIDTLVGPNDDWLNNLTMIDEYLEQNS